MPNPPNPPPHSPTRHTPLFALPAPHYSRHLSFGFESHPRLLFEFPKQVGGCDEDVGAQQKQADEPLRIGKGMRGCGGDDNDILSIYYRSDEMICSLWLPRHASIHNASRQYHPTPPLPSPTPLQHCIIPHPQPNPLIYTSSPPLPFHPPSFAPTPTPHPTPLTCDLPSAVTVLASMTDRKNMSVDSGSRSNANGLPMAQPASTANGMARMAIWMEEPRATGGGGRENGDMRC